MNHKDPTWFGGFARFGGERSTQLLVGRSGSSDGFLQGNSRMQSPDWRFFSFFYSFEDGEQIEAFPDANNVFTLSGTDVFERKETAAAHTIGCTELTGGLSKNDKKSWYLLEREKAWSALVFDCTRKLKIVQKDASSPSVLIWENRMATNHTPTQTYSKINCKNTNYKAIPNKPDPNLFLKSVLL